MARVRLIHWNASEAAGHLELLRGAGHLVDYDQQINPGMNRKMRETQPDVVVIDLSRLPSHGREVGVYLRGQKTMRHLPLIFTGGEPEKVAIVRGVLPDATYTTLAQLKSAIRSALKNQPAAPVVPPQMMDRYAGRSSAQKMGIKPGSTVAVYDAPRNYAKVLGELPEGVTLLEEPKSACEVTLWFAHDPETFLAALPRMLRVATKTKLWVAWKKKSAAPDSRLSENFIRDSGIAAGLVDYKVCAVDSTWSGLAMALKNKDAILLKRTS